MNRGKAANFKIIERHFGEEIYKHSSYWVYEYEEKYKQWFLRRYFTEKAEALRFIADECVF